MIECQGDKTREISIARRSAWISKINRKAWCPGPGARVCSIHFISGKPSTVYDLNNPDWAPSVNMGYESSESCQASRRYQRLKERNKSAASTSSKESNLSYDDDSVPGIACQTELTGVMIDDREKLIKSLQHDNMILRQDLIQAKEDNSTNTISLEAFQKKDDLVKFYTGLSCWRVFSAVITLVSPALPPMPNSKLSVFECIVMFLMKLRLNLMDEDIAFRFGVHQSTVSHNFHKILDIMNARLTHLIKWPDRETLRETLPTSFRKFFKKACVIIDCTEIFIEQPSDLLARAQVWSNYKHHSTIKFLIGITPQGTISYVSQCAGGRMSDKEIVERSSLIDYLLPGDTIIADRGFRCDEYAHMALAEIKIPPFTKGKKQLEKVEVDWSRELSMVRIHVERLIGVLKQKYTILQHTLPISMIADKDEQQASIDKIVRVCCSLVNLCPSVVPQD